jgi:hypothetical protein
MARNRPDDEEKLLNLMRGLGERVIALPDGELAEELRADGVDPDEIAREGGRIRRQALKDFRLSDLRAARARYERHAAEYEGARGLLPGTPDTRRAALDAILASPTAASLAHITAQFRDLKEMSDEDVDSYYRQMLLLGVIIPDAAEPEQAEGE